MVNLIEMTEDEKDQIERRLVELRDAFLDGMKATGQTYEAELAYVTAEAGLRDFVGRRAREPP